MVLVDGPWLVTIISSMLECIRWGNGTATVAFSPQIRMKINFHSYEKEKEGLFEIFEDDKFIDKKSQIKSYNPNVHIISKKLDLVDYMNKDFIPI